MYNIPLIVNNTVLHTSTFMKRIGPMLSVLKQGKRNIRKL